MVMDFQLTHCLLLCSQTGPLRPPYNSAPSSIGIYSGECFSQENNWKTCRFYQCTVGVVMNAKQESCESHFSALYNLVEILDQQPLAFEVVVSSITSSSKLVV